MSTLPKFPRFEPFTLHHGNLLPSYTLSLPPYGNLSPSSLWAYAESRHVSVATFGGNLVTRFHNTVTNAFCYAFAGEVNAEISAQTLLDHVAKEQLRPELLLVPEETVRHLTAPEFSLEQDMDAAEYVLDATELVALQGHRYAQMRRRVRLFWRQHQAHAEQIDLTCAENVQQIVTLHNDWLRLQTDEAGVLLWGEEDRALRRLLSVSEIFPLVAVGLRIRERLIAFLIAELLPAGWAMHHFMKALTAEFPYAYDAVIHETARLLLDNGVMLINHQEDGGLRNLRAAKERCQPARFLRCYTVRSSRISFPRAEPHLIVADTSSTGKGLFTNKAIKQGETAFVMQGLSRPYQSRTAEDAHRYENWLGIGKDLFLDPDPPYVFANHSCHPNLGIRGTTEFVALRDIPAGAELTYDYSLTTDEKPWTMVCACGHKYCRGVIGSIHYLPESIYRKYLPFVGEYFQAVFDAERAAFADEETQ